MSIVSSNMISKHYCPKCNSFDLFKLHRSFVEKRILGSQNKIQCKACEQVFKPSVFESNIPKEVPVFIDQIQQRPTAANADSQAKVTSKVVVEDPMIEKVIEDPLIKEAVVNEGKIEVKHSVSSSLSKASSKMMLNGDFMSEDNFKVTETLRPKVDEQKPKVRKAPPAHNRGEQIVDEPILTTEKKGVWPYVVGSTMVLLGATYAFVWMPLISNASTPDITQMDMSIGSPGQVWSDTKAKIASVLPEVVDLKDSDTVEKSVMNPSAQLSSGTTPVKSEIQVKLEEIALGNQGNDSGAVEQSAQALLLAKADLAAETNEEELEKTIEDAAINLKPISAEIGSKPLVTKAASLTVKDYSLKHNIGTKADNALGGLSVDSSVPTVDESKQSNVVIESSNEVKVPLPDTSVRQYIVKSVITQPVLKAINKPAEVKTVTNKLKTQSVKKTQVSSNSKKLLERATVKLMQQDLDNLF